MFIFMVVFFSVQSQIMQGISEGFISNPGFNSGLSPNATASQYFDVDMFHGNCHVNIPLYNYKSKHLSIPIGLNYTPPDGSMDVFHPGWTGLGWRLSAGGLITRSIRENPDELSNFINPYEYEDEFTFNFCGYSGRFFYHQGNPIFISDVDIVYFIPFYDIDRLISGFTFQMPDGIIYTFGHEQAPNNGDYNAVEYSIPFEGASYGKGHPITWHLTKIESPDGDCINFFYDRGDAICYLPTPYSHCNISAVYNGKIYSQTSYSMMNHTETYSNNLDSERRCYVINPSYLRKISGHSAVSIEFDRSITNERTYPPNYYPTGTSGFPPMVWYKLDAIRLKWNDRCFKRFQLGYQDVPSGVLNLTSVKEIGVGANNQEISMPDYKLTYEGVNTGFSIYALHRITYPTGGFTEFEYDSHVYSTGCYFLHSTFPSPPSSEDCDVIYVDKGARIKKISSFTAEDETPYITEYHYVREGDYPNANAITSGEVSRTEKKNVKIIFAALWGNVTWEKNSSFDMPSLTPGLPAPDIVGYSSVYKVTKKGEEKIDVEHYLFTNYHSDFNSYNNEGQRYLYHPVGKLLRVTNSIKRIDFDYNDPEQRTDTILHKYTEYLPFKFDNKIYSRENTNWEMHLYRKYRTKRIIEYTRGSLEDTLSVTTLTYSPLGNITGREILNKLDGNVYTTNYRYRYNSPIDVRQAGGRLANVPFETVTYKNGKIVGAEVIWFRDLYNSSAGRSFILPGKRYILASETPLNSYQPAVYLSGNVDPHCKLVETFNYYPDGRLSNYQKTGQEPFTFEWAEYDYPVMQQIGDMVIRYTYNEHGVTSITDANGSVQYTEYDALGRPVVTKDHSGNILQSVNYNLGINQ